LSLALFFFQYQRMQFQLNLGLWRKNNIKTMVSTVFCRTAGVMNMDRIWADRARANAYVPNANGTYDVYNTRRSIGGKIKSF
jgi:hypothetical protein